MSDTDREYKLADTRARFAVAVREGRAVTDVTWTPGRVLLSNRRLVLAGNDGRQTVPLSRVDGLGGRHDANQTIARVSNYVSFELDERVLLVAAADHESFERDVYRALLDGSTPLVRHPAVVGGVVSDADWERARLGVGEDGLSAALESGAFVRFDLDDVSGLEATERTVADRKRPVLEVAHTDDDGTSVETHLSGDPRQMRFVEAWLRKGTARSAANVELSSRDREVLMALYSGVSPFEISAFLGVEVDAVEETFTRLVDLEIVELVRTRQEVSLNARGRNIASEAMNEQ
jgi:helix-turn-helix protein